MNILPRLLYHFQMVPILFNNKTIRRVNGWIRSFIWNRKKPQLKMSKLHMSVEQGGLAVPNIRLYQLATQLRYIDEWINNDPESVWLDLESVNAGNGLSRKTKNVGDNNILITTSLQAW